MENDTASMTEPTLSPAAQVVLDAYNSGFDRPVAVHHKPRIAAALRAAIAAGHDYDSSLIIENILSIAAELENQ